MLVSSKVKLFEVGKRENDRHFFVILFLVIFLFSQCRKSIPSDCDTATPLFLSSTFPIGAAVDDLLLNNDSLYRKTFLKQFNSATAENIFKPAYLHPEENLYHWNDADKLLKLCSDHNIRLHGHTLIWHQQNPLWMESFQGSQQAWDAMMRLHIHTIVSYFKQTVLSWDVVNEAFNDDGSLRKTIWLKHIGPSYIEKAFQYAHEANPRATLFYNDYNLETKPIKRKAVLQFLYNLKAKGVPIDGIGMQMHLNIKYDDISMIESAMQDIVNQHYIVHLSEVDISLNPFGDDYVLQKNDLEEQAILMYKLVRAYKNIPIRQQFGITIWGISDPYSWIRNYYNRIDYPLLFDENFNPKPVYCQLKQAL